MREIQTGWGNPTPSSKFNFGRNPEFHYFGGDGLSLCRRWGVGHTREVEEGRDDHPDNCPLCVKAMEKQKMGAAVAEV